MQRSDRLRWTMGTLAVTGLVIIFLFQGYDVARVLGMEGKTLRFIVNRSIRFLLNDGLAIILILAIFKERKYLIFALMVQVAGMLFILIPYFILKIYYQVYNGPLISFLHRLVLNPTLLLILIPAFYYQQRNSNKVQTEEDD